MLLFILCINHISTYLCNYAASVLALAAYYSIIVYLTPNNADNEYNDFWKKYDTPPMIFIGVIDFLLNVSLLYLFVSKLKEILQVRLLNCDIYSIINESSQNDSIDEDASQQSADLLRLMTRHTILFGIAIITNQIWYITVLIQTKKDYNFYISDFCFRALENLCNCIVLFMGLKKNLKCYMCICSCCDKKMEKCFIRRIQKKLDEANGNIERNKANSAASTLLPTPQDLNTINEES